MEKKKALILLVFGVLFVAGSTIVAVILTGRKKNNQQGGSPNIKPPDTPIIPPNNGNGSGSEPEPVYTGNYITGEKPDYSNSDLVTLLQPSSASNYLPKIYKDKNGSQLLKTYEKGTWLGFILLSEADLNTTYIPIYAYVSKDSKGKMYYQKAYIKKIDTIHSTGMSWKLMKDFLGLANL